MVVTVADLINKIPFRTIYGSEAALNKLITGADITRPGLEMSGYLDYFSPERVQLFGKKEHSYMMGLSSERRLFALKQVITEETPVVIVARDLEVPSEMLQAAEARDVALLQSKDTTSRLSGKIASYLGDCLAPRTSIHGVLMDIYGLGVLIRGESGIGKSELGLELIRRGHRLVADDRVEIYKRDDLIVIGESPEILKNMLEIRGVGIIDAMNLFGAGAVKDYVGIDLVVQLENFDGQTDYDRLGMDSYTTHLVDVALPLLRIPVKIGRNISVILEAAVMNFRAKDSGYNAAEVFEERLTNLISKNTEL